MNTLILLFLVIGSVVSEVLLTTGTATAAVEWSLTYTNATGENFYGYTLVLRGKDLEPLEVTAEVVADTDYFTGVVCVETTSDHSRRSGPGFGWTLVNAIGSARSAGSTSNALTLGAITLTYYPALAITEDNATPGIGNGQTGGGAIVCNIADAAGTAHTVPTATPSVSNSVEFISSGINSCGNLKASGVGFYARCYNVVFQTAEWSVAGDTLLTAVNTGTDVTFAATALPTCVLNGNENGNGASTFATGATILAGIAYLQF
jgi:hypothetical protein